MEDQTPLGSQENPLSSRATSTSRENLGSSPVLPTLDKRHGSKPRKAPTITPRTFTRFFTPKSSLERGGRIGASRQALRDITASASNRKGRRTSTKDTIQIFEGDGEGVVLGSKRRKRKIPDSLDMTPDRSSPLKRIRNQSLEISEDEGSDTGTNESRDDAEDPFRRYGRQPNSIERIIGSNYHGCQGRYLRREIGIQRRASELRCFGRSVGMSEWQQETTHFSTRPEDAHVCMNVAAPSDHTIPFCTTSCNTNTLVAIGDEDGGVRLLESSKGEKPEFSKAYLAFRPHSNAILDLAFSRDDLLLATASGDQTSQVIDMPTQRATYTLAGHVSSVKQVCFQPGSSNVLASSSRDGSVQIWDLRCKGFDAPVRDIRVSVEPSSISTTRSSVPNKLTWARSVNTIFEAHASRQPASTNAAASGRLAPSFDAPSKTESPGRRGDVSITALSFLHPGREHLFLTASEANASVKLWDLRTTHNHRRSRATPLSSTRQPDSHNKHRHFGLTSLSLSGDGGRLYALCRDNTIYAYSTSHLILGHAPELSKSFLKPRRSGGSEKEGLGPIYGFRHPKFHATTFYVKSALRPAKDDQSEMLAVGSSDGCAVIFPTDERYLQRSNHQRMLFSDSPFPRSRPSLTRTDSGTGLSTRLEDTIPIYQHGSALIRGHSREMTGLTWSPRGELVTVGDDFVARCWREDDAYARDLRLGGEKEGRRWGCGWAEAEKGWDDDDG
ncbi:hypothetical protein HO173_009954 [Letharia columbiana]|uniref:WD40 repeat-like protein n=1 Tax=Letharia columbiana TaxID=112416 RepID=A0A8H6L1C4_9LECA|nr:uncharacterized protein HO173_009954 [Letharia columbiana]KAF6231871.1 hypothetical protein HO173_009954 [Letharia columbiana]